MDIEISTERMLRSAAALHLSGRLPMPYSFSMDRLVNAGGMRPLLRLTLAMEDVRRLHENDMAGWWMGALLKHVKPARWHDDETQDREQDHAVMMVLSCIAEISPSTSVFSFIGHLERQTETLSGKARVEPLLTWMKTISHEKSFDRHIAKAIQILAEAIGAEDPYNDPMTIPEGLWDRHEIDGTIDLIEDGRRQNGVIVTRVLTVKMDDGRIERHGVEAGYLSIIYSPPGTRVRLYYKGSTPEHPGYGWNIRTLEDVEFTEQIQRSVALSKHLAEMKDIRAIDGNGVEIEKSQTVEIQADCLETHRGNRGKVVEVLGDMAIVAFSGVKAPVPCYGNVLHIV